MTKPTYAPPVSQLLSLGDVHQQTKLDYLALGFSIEHVPELSRLLLDDDIFWSESEVEVWAVVHAWRALGQIGSLDAIGPLIERLVRIDKFPDDDWTPTELPDIFAQLGPASLPALADLLQNGEGLWARTASSDSIAKIAQVHPDARPDCIAALTRALEGFAGQSPVLNGFIISNLLNLQAVQAAPLMEKAFAANEVDISICGDWEDAQIGLGLLDERITPASYHTWDEFLTPAEKPEVLSPAAHTPTGSSQNQQKRKARQKRKQQKTSRRKQRKK